MSCQHSSRLCLHPLPICNSVNLLKMLHFVLDEDSGSIITGSENSSAKGSDQLLNDKMKNSLLLKLSRKIKDIEGLYQSFLLYNIYCNHQENALKKKLKQKHKSNKQKPITKKPPNPSKITLNLPDK